jgi:hypothetical protein
MIRHLCLIGTGLRRSGKGEVMVAGYLLLELVDFVLEKTEIIDGFSAIVFLEVHDEATPQRVDQCLTIFSEIDQ